jgi:hypothetical protein
MAVSFDHSSEREHAINHWTKQPSAERIGDIFNRLALAVRVCQKVSDNPSFNRDPLAKCFKHRDCHALATQGAINVDHAFRHGPDQFWQKDTSDWIECHARSLAASDLRDLIREINLRPSDDMLGPRIKQPLFFLACPLQIPMKPPLCSEMIAPPDSGMISPP